VLFPERQGTFEAIVRRRGMLRRRRWTLLSIALHSALFAVLLRPSKRVDHPRQPPQVAAYVVFRSVPKPAGPSGPAPRAPLRTVKARRLVQPREAPKAPQPEALTQPLENESEVQPLESDFPLSEGELVTGPGGFGKSPSGEGTGTGGGGPDGRAPRAFDERTMIPPHRLTGRDPEYTPKALQYEVEGVMQVLCRVSIEGRVSECRIVRSLPYMGEAVIAALEACTYSPARLPDGTAIEVDYIFKILMKLTQ
jgi:protein TonB